MKNDPVKHCTLYKEAGCSHVDGYLCDFPKCSMYQKHEDHKMKEESPYVPHMITAEISLGSARYKEMQIIPCLEHLVDQESVLACTIERMQKNMEDVLNEY